MRRFSRIIFSRYAISLFLILLEFLLMFAIVWYAEEYSVIAFAIFLMIEALTLISIINREANPEYKIPWIVIVLTFAPFGALLYAIFYSRRLSKKETRLIEAVYEEIEDSSRIIGGEVMDEEFMHLSKLDKSAAGKAALILNDDPLSALYRHTHTDFFSSGEEMYKSMISDIEGAERYIFLEYFIIEHGVMWDGIYAALTKKASLGVEVRVMYDDMGCMGTLPRGFDKTLMRDGIRCAAFSPLTPRIKTAHNNRDHRKILIIDGKIGYTGGINIADEYINAKNKLGHWKDGGIRLSGEGVRGLLKLFLGQWNFNTGSVIETKSYLSEPTPPKESDGFILPFGTGPAPIYPRQVGKNALLSIINQSQTYVYITTPYLIIDYDLTEALRCAAHRGVDVRIITPNKADKKGVKIMTKSAYPHLISAGVKIYEYLPGFIHEKTVVSDDVYALVGTINLDYRSLAHHFENAVWMYGCGVIEEIRDEFLKTVSISCEIDCDTARLNLFEKLIRNAIKLFAPLL